MNKEELETSLLPLLTEELLAVTLGIFSGITRKLGMLFFKEIDHKILIFNTTSEGSAAFLLTHKSTGRTDGGVGQTTGLFQSQMLEWY